MLTAQESFWKTDFGNSYTERNNPNWKKRVPFFLDMLHLAKSPRSILEVGCNKGVNLKCIRAIDPMIAAWGCDVNQQALQQASDAGLSVAECSVFDLKKEWKHGGFDLTMTVGMLIHIGPKDLERAMRSIIGASKRYVLAVEYADETEVEVNYRGHSERLWRRPFGKLYEALGLKMVAQGEAPGDAFDRCAFWLMERK